MSAVAEAQAMAALRLANVTRLQRASLRRALRQRELTLADVIDSPAVATMRICDLLEAVPGLSNAKVGALLLTLAIGYQRPVARVTASQRRDLFRLLAQRHPGIRTR